MMGNRCSPDGIEVDAFSRRWRRMLSWPRGELRLIKRQFSKRMRKAARTAAKKETADLSSS